MGWYVDGLPCWMTGTELNDFGLPVDLFYKPISLITDLLLTQNESIINYYERSKNILSKYF